MASQGWASRAADFLTLDRILSYGLGVLSTVVGIVITYRHRRVKDPFYTVLSNTLLRGHTDKVPGLEIRLVGESIENLTMARIAIWNAGREPIDRGDFAESDPFAIQAAPGVRILQVLPYWSSSPASSIAAAISPDKNRALLSFEFLNHESGAVLQVMHTGTQATDLTLTGSLKGSGPFRRTDVAAQGKGRMITTRKSPFERFVLLPSVYALPVTFSAAMYLSETSQGNRVVVDERAVSIVLSFQIAWLGFMWLARRRMKTLPGGFEKIAQGLFDK